MDNHNTLKSDAVEDELVAYLDGELDVAARQRVEERLARDADYRSRLQGLQQAWDLLDVLPRSGASESFTRTTVEMVALSAAQDVERLERSVKRQRHWAWLFGSGGVLVAAVVGYFVVTTLLAAPERNFLIQLPVLINLDFYRQADSVEFLRQLDRDGLFSGADRGNVTMILFEPRQSLDARRSQLLKATPTQLGDLQSSQERFQRLTSEEQRHLLRIHDELSLDPQAARLRQVLELYVDWLKSLPSGKPAELRALPTEKRVAEIKRLLNDHEEQQFRRFAQNRPFPPEDTRAIFTWLDRWLEQNMKQIEAQMPPLGLERLREIPDPQRRRMMMYGFYLKQRQEKGGERPGQEILTPGAADVRELEKTLSPDSQKLLAKAQSGREELRLVQEWTRAAVLSRMIPTATEEELARFYREELAVAERSRLDGLPRDEFQRELRKLFFEYRMKKNPLGRTFIKGQGTSFAPLNEGNRPVRPATGGDRRENAERRMP